MKHSSKLTQKLSEDLLPKDKPMEEAPPVDAPDPWMPPTEPEVPLIEEPPSEDIPEPWTPPSETEIPPNIEPPPASPLSPPMP